VSVPIFLNSCTVIPLQVCNLFCIIRLGREDVVSLSLRQFLSQLIRYKNIDQEMNILAVCTWYIPQFIGGVETRMGSICQSLSSEHRVKVFCRNKEPFETVDHVGSVEVVRQKFSFPKLRLMKNILSHRQDYFNGFDINFDFDLCLSTSFGYTLGIKKKYPSKKLKILIPARLNYLYSPNIPHIGTEERLWRYFDCAVTGYMEKRALTLADKIIVSSKPVYHSIVRECGIEKSKLILLPQGTDLKRFSGKRDRSILKSFGIADDKFVILAVSRLVLEKNIPLLIKSMKYMKDGAVCLIVGGGREKHFLEKLAEDENVRNKIIFTGETPEVERYYAAADIFAHPATYEGFGNVLIEAMAYGLPCVALDFNPDAGIHVATREIINDDVGFRVANNERAFSAAMNKLKDDRQLRESMSKSARYRAKVNYSLVDYVHNILAA